MPAMPAAAARPIVPQDGAEDCAVSTDGEGATDWMLCMIATRGVNERDVGSSAIGTFRQAEGAG